MRIWMIRHADPDYEHDCLTEKGNREAEALADYLSARQIDAFYCSPLGRAQKTAEATLEKMGRSAQVEDWLKEFPSRIDRPDAPGKKSIAWDWLPSDWTEKPEFYEADGWWKEEHMMEGQVKEDYDYVADSLDRLLAEYGYQRQGKVYRVREPNHLTLVFFCHLGVQCVMLSHLWSCSPMVLWHGLCQRAASITEVVTEEREKGTASFRALRLGDVSWLEDRGMEPSFSGRFVECYDDAGRHA